MRPPYYRRKSTRLGSNESSYSHNNQAPAGWLDLIDCGRMMMP
jgi:hypothetical protein